MPLPAFVIPAIISAISAAAPLFQKKEQQEQIPTVGPEQQNLVNQLTQLLRGQLGGQGLFGQSQNFLQDILGGDTSKFEAPLMRQFNEQIIPGLSERFAGLGAGSSSAFQQALGGAGSGLMERLGALRGQLGLQASGQGLQSILGLLGGALTPTFQTGIRPGSPGPLANFIAPIAGGFGKSFGEYGGQKLAEQYFK